jgi:hypothetical protein
LFDRIFVNHGQIQRMLDIGISRSNGHAARQTLLCAIHVFIPSSSAQKHSTRRVQLLARTVHDVSASDLKLSSSPSRTVRSRAASVVSSNSASTVKLSIQANYFSEVLRLFLVLVILVPLSEQSRSSV